jgi:hypothetical protein
MVLTMDAGHIDVDLPITREFVRHGTQLAAQVTGCLADGQNFDEEAVIRDLSIRGAFVHLEHTPKLQSTLQVTIKSLDGSSDAKPLVLRGHVVRVEPAACPGKTGVGILFAE